jgi:hypothetical protein
MPQAAEELVIDQQRRIATLEAEIAALKANAGVPRIPHRCSDRFCCFAAVEIIIAAGK